MSQAGSRPEGEGLAGAHAHWRVEGSTAVRELGPPTLATDGLSAGLRAAAAARGRELDIREGPHSMTLVIGADRPVTSADDEILSALDAIIDAGGDLPGSQDPG